MVISDLQYLESVETASIVGAGGRRRSKKGHGGFNFVQAIQINVAVLNKGDVYQANVISQS